MVRACEVEALTTIVNPNDGRLVDVVNVRRTNTGYVEITGIDGRWFQLPPDGFVHVLDEPEAPLDWLRVAVTLGVLFGVVVLLIVVGFLGRP